MVVQPVRVVTVALLYVIISRLPPRCDAVLSLIPLINLKNGPIEVFTVPSLFPTCTIFLILTAGIEIPYLDIKLSASFLFFHYILFVFEAVLDVQLATDQHQSSVIFVKNNLAS